MRRSQPAILQFPAVGFGEPENKPYGVPVALHGVKFAVLAQREAGRGFV